MKFIAKLLIPIFRKYLLKQIEENKTFIISKLNKHIDLPNLSESEEAELMNKMYDAVVDITKSFLGHKE